MAEESVVTPVPASIEDRMSAYLNRPRDEQGRFAASGDTQPSESAESDQPPEEESAPEQEVVEQQAEQEQTDQPEGESADASVIVVPGLGEDGGDLKLTQDEVVAGYMRQADYTRKTQAVAEEVSKVRDDAVRVLDDFTALTLHTLQSELTGVDWQQLAQDSPADYVAKKARAEQLQGTLNQLQAKRAEYEQAQQREAARRVQEEAEKSAKVLKAKIPDLTPEKYSGIVRDFAKLYGYTPDELANVIDHRAILAMHDLVQLKSAKASNPATNNRVVVRKATVKPGGGQQSMTVSEQRQAEARAKLKKSGRMEDAAALFRLRLG